MSAPLRLVLVQPDVVWEDRAANFARVRALLDAQPPPPGALVVLPEMFAVGFSMHVDAVCEGEERPTERFLAETARRYDACVLGGLVTRAPDGRGRNEAVAVTPDGRVAARYVKLHPFSYAGEDRHYAPGESVVTFAWQGFTVAPFVCYDLRFPEAYRAAAARGADLLVTIANWPTPRVHHWTTLLTARAVENQAYSAGVNRVGTDPHLAYPGRSLVVDPQGRVVADGGEARGIVAADLSAADLRDYRARFPALRDMRRDLLPQAGDPMNP